MIEKSIDKLTNAIEHLATAIEGKEVATATPKPSAEPAKPVKEAKPAKPEKPAEPEKEEAEPEATPAEVTLTELREVGKKILKARKSAEMRDVLESLGAESLTTLDESKYEEVLPKLEALLK